MAGTLSIEVVFAMPTKQWLGRMQVSPGTSVREAILASPVATEFPDFDFASCALGVWGKPVDDSHVLADGDRVEAYRELLHDPREARRELAKQGQFMGSAAGPDSKDPA